MDSDPPTKRASQQLKAAEGSGEKDPPDAGERPTVIPPFDLESFARDSMPASLDPADQARLLRKSPDSPTMVPASGGDEGGDTLAAIPPMAADAFRSEFPTFTNERELEEARRASILTFSSVPPAKRSAAPVSDPAAAHSGPPGSTGLVSALSLADMRMPTPPPMNAVASDEPDSESTFASTRKARSSYVDSRELPPPSQLDPLVDMRDRYSLGDYSGALAIAEVVLVRSPSNVEAAKIAEACQSVLVKMYASRIGPLDRVPMVMVQPHELRWLSIDHRAGFLLSLVDGMSSIEMILDVSGMPLLDTLRILHELSQQRVISFRT